MNQHGTLLLRIVDLLGGCLVAGCLIGFVHLTVIRGDQTASDIAELSRMIREGRQQVRALRATFDRQGASLAQHQAELTQRGRLPTETPVEEYFQTLSTIASKHRLRVLRHNPLPSRQYSELFEQRYAYEVAGSMPDLVRFFRAVEDADFWADISYLSVKRGATVKEGQSNERIAALTFSLFSAPHPDAPSESTGA